jgi:hypothetical protein
VCDLETSRIGAPYIYDISNLRVNELGLHKITHIIGKNINQITFYSAEEGPGRGSEDIKKECIVNCFDFIFFSVFLMDVMGGKIHSRL